MKDFPGARPLRRVMIIFILLICLLICGSAAADLLFQLEPVGGDHGWSFVLGGEPVPAALYRPPVLLCGYDDDAAATILERLASLDDRDIPNRRGLSHHPDGVIEAAELAAYAGPPASLFLGPGFDGSQPVNPLLDVLAPPDDGWETLEPFDLLAAGWNMRWDPGFLEPTSWSVRVPARLHVPAGEVVGQSRHRLLAEPPALVYRAPDGRLRRLSLVETEETETIPGVWRTLEAPGIQAGNSLELSELPPPADGHLLNAAQPLAGVVTVPGGVYLLRSGDTPSVGRLGGVRRTAWELNLAAAPSSWLAWNEGLIVVDEASHLHLIEPDGSCRSYEWPERLPPRLSADENSLVILGGLHCALLEPEVEELRLIELPSPATSGGVLFGRLLLYGSGTDLVVLNVDDGDWWSQRLGGSLTLTPVPLGGLVHCACGDHRLYILDPTRSVAPLVEVRELGSPPTLTVALPNLGLLVGMADGRLRLFSGKKEYELDLEGVPRGPVARRGERLLLPLGTNGLVELDLSGTPFDPFKPGFKEPTVVASLRLPAELLDGPATFHPPVGLKATPAQLRQGAVYVVDGDGVLWIIAELD